MIARLGLDLGRLYLLLDAGMDYSVPLMLAEKAERLNSFDMRVISEEELDQFARETHACTLTPGG